MGFQKIQNKCSERLMAIGKTNHWHKVLRRFRAVFLPPASSFTVSLLRFVGAERAKALLLLFAAIEAGNEELRRGSDLLGNNFSSQLSENFQTFCIYYLTNLHIERFVAVSADKIPVQFSDLQRQTGKPIPRPFPCML